MERTMHDHTDALMAARGGLPQDELLCDLADLFKIFGDTTRMKILFALFEKEKDLALPKTQVDMHVRINGGVAELELTAKQYVRFLQIHSQTNPMPFSDNFFDLLPGETKRVLFPVPEGVTADRLQNDLTLFSAGDVVPRASRLSDWWTRARVALRPLSIGNYIYYQRIPK